MMADKYQAGVYYSPSGLGALVSSLCRHEIGE
jgi:hypothetical protein